MSELKPSDFSKLAFKLYENGMFDKEIADRCGVCKTTIFNWRRKNKLLPHGVHTPKNSKHGAWTFSQRLYTVWSSMKHRCEDPKREKYKNYGARGIRVCEAWHDPIVFIEWAITHGYKPGLQLDREDNDKGYYPENCRWVTPKQNSRNRGNNQNLTIGAETKTITEWAEITGISVNTLYWDKRNKGTDYAKSKIIDALNEGKQNGKVA